jgi:hypothetical protein
MNNACMISNHRPIYVLGIGHAVMAFYTDRAWNGGWFRLDSEVAERNGLQTHSRKGGAGSNPALDSTFLPS